MRVLKSDTKGKALKRILLRVSKHSLGRTYLVEKIVFEEPCHLSREWFPKKEIDYKRQIFSDSILAITQEDHEELQRKSKTNGNEEEPIFRSAKQKKWFKSNN